MDKELPFISVMLPIRNESRYIAETLAQLIDQDYPADRFELIVVNGVSTDDTAEIVSRFIDAHPSFQISLLENPKMLSSAARNIACRNALGDYILLIDGHVHIPTNTLLTEYAKAALENDAKVLGRPQPLDPPGISPFQKAVNQTRQSPLAHSGESFVYSDHGGWVSPISVGVMYHKSVFDVVGYFDESFDAAEDLEFNYRLEKSGYRCYISPSLAVKYYPRESPLALFKQLKRYGYGRSLFIQKHPERFTLETVIPAAFVAFLFTGVFLALLSTALFLSWALILSLYCVLLLAESVRLARKNGLHCLTLSPVIIFCIHTGLGFGFIRGLLMNLPIFHLNTKGR